jgi:17beta-estradiol 17-dehydrogenase / very-long-chain 3-oxoacyl-CoA reductase
MQKAFPERDIVVLIADASRSDLDISGALKSIKDKPVTVLVNNLGGIFTEKKFVSLGDNTSLEIDENINLNARFLTQLTRAVLPILEHNAPALIINMGSIAAVAGLPLGSVYAGGKAYDMAFSNSLRLEMGFMKKDVEVLGIMVGGVNSGTNKARVNFFVPSSRQMANAALNRVGCGKAAVWGVFQHGLMTWILQLLPQALLDRIIIMICRDRMEDERKS